MARATVAIVDDEALHRELLNDILDAEDYAVVAVASASDALAAATPIDLFLVDVLMPGIDGIELCRQLKAREETRSTPVVLVTGLNALADRIRGIDAGADDFLSKPVNAAELLARVRSLVRLKRYTDQLDHAEAVLFSLARSVEAKDGQLQGHCERLAQHVVAMGESLGLDAVSLDALRRGALLHDIGKIGIPDAILFKPGPLTAEEWTVMREHPVIGERICEPLRSMRPVLPIIRGHHERWNGSGYPDGLAGTAIPLTARILQIADVFDALTTIRPYRQPVSPAEALAIIRDETQRQLWDGSLVELFGRVVDGRRARRDLPEVRSSHASLS